MPVEVELKRTKAEQLLPEGGWAGWGRGLINNHNDVEMLKCGELGHIPSLSNERVNGPCNFPKPLKSQKIDGRKKERVREIDREGKDRAWGAYYKKLATRTLRWRLSYGLA